MSLDEQQSVEEDVPKENREEHALVDTKKAIESLESSFGDITTGREEKATTILSEVLGTDI